MIHVMNGARSETSLRDRKRTETRARILAAAAELLVSEDAAALSIPAISQRCDVSIRTIYRYFPTKADLVSAVGVMDDPAVTAGPLPALDGSDLHAWLRRGWSDEIQTPLLRAQLRTAAGVDVRRDRRARHRAFAFAVIDEWELDLDPASRRALADLLLLLTGGAALVELADVLEMSVTQAAAAATWAVEAILTHAHATGSIPDGTRDFAMTMPASDRSTE